LQGGRFAAIESAQRTPVGVISAVGVIWAVGVLAAAVLSIAFGSLLQRKQPR
jgi:hypothetical protein